MMELTFDDVESLAASMMCFSSKFCSFSSIFFGLRRLDFCGKTGAGGFGGDVLSCSVSL